MNLPPEPRDMPPGRHAARRAHLMREMTARPPMRHRRLLVGGALTAALAGGITAALVIAPATSVGGRPPAANAEAAEVFHRAANAAETSPDPAPRPGQFLYVESRQVQNAVPGRPASATRRKVWLPADRRDPGLLLSDMGGRTWERIWLCDRELGIDEKSGVAAQSAVRPPARCDYGHPVVRNDLPTDPGRMHAWLYRNSQGGNPPDVQAFVTVGDTLREAYVPPAALSAMFKAAARIPGVTVTDRALDFADRRGIAVGQTWQGVRRELIFDAGTYRLLGEREVVDYDTSFRPTGGSTPLAPSGEPSDLPSATPSAPVPTPPPGRPSDEPSDLPSAVPTGKPITPPQRTMKEGTVLYQSATLKTAVTDELGETP
ncbi:CU044_5270 family protein [Thermomonospora cellulosilytica]|uniref:Uncharacterized protein n=1 Tax=Thermomonospora cellulosilytica TaxID=1411118 RepID=A0A7W3MTY2_9ACTN|nr:CU044_5270 family protein [Thermomonospora cellulosilytica]MBA9001838.1 hypothetical protein [Thermomonospora cellulosilytica]